MSVDYLQQGRKLVQPAQFDDFVNIRAKYVFHVDSGQLEIVLHSSNAHFLIRRRRKIQSWRSCARVPNAAQRVGVHVEQDELETGGTDSKVHGQMQNIV